MLNRKELTNYFSRPLLWFCHELSPEPEEHKNSLPLGQSQEKGIYDSLRTYKLCSFPCLKFLFSCPHHPFLYTPALYHASLFHLDFWCLYPYLLSLVCFLTCIGIILIKAEKWQLILDNIGAQEDGRRQKQQVMKNAEPLWPKTPNFYLNQERCKWQCIWD